jgi:hypothetical protein
MVRMKNISEIEPILYTSYFLTEEDGDIILKFNTSIGLVDIDANDYDTFSTEVGTLIAFKKFHSGVHNYVYFSGLEKKNFQNISYESFQEHFDRQIDEFFVVYSFLDSSVVPARDNQSLAYNFIPDSFVRCDYGMLGVKPFYLLPNRLSIKRTASLMDIAGVGHLLCTFTDNTENPNKDSQGANANARTLTGALKTIYEWSEVYKPPFSNQEPIAKAAYDFLNEIGMPEDVLADIINSQGDMKVARYLKGETRQVYDIDENTQTPDSLKKFINNRCKYSYLFNMKNSHINGFAIPNDLIAKEKECLVSKIFEFCVMHGIDFNNYQEVIDYFALHPNEEIEKLIDLYNKIN